MIEVSNKYKQAVYAPSRKSEATATFEILDNSAYNDNTSSVSSEVVFSRKDQLTNKVRTMSSKFATFERDYWRLDGSFEFPAEVPNDDEIGWWSDEISNVDGAFVTPQVVEFNFTEEHSTMGLTIHFDSLNKEYATDFDIDVYDATGLLINHEAITNNSSTMFVFIQGLDDFKRIKITVKKWVNGYRRARVVEVDFGVVKIYEGDKLIRLNIIEQMTAVGDTLPANELKFTIDNSNREFNILNPNGFYRFFKERQEVSTQIGIEIAEGQFEFINFGKYYLVDWQSDEGALTTTFTARNIFELLETKEYAFSFNGSLYDLAVEVMTLAEIDKYEIDEALKDISVEYIVDKVTLRSLLQFIGIAGKCAIFQSRSNVLTIKRFVVLDESTSYIHFAGLDMFTGMVTPAIDKGFDMKNIDFDNVYNEPQIKLDKLIRTITLKVYETGNEHEITFLNGSIKEGEALTCDNPLIQTDAHAQEIAEWIVSEYNLRALYNVNWRQNPCLECGDIVIVEDAFDAKKQSRITKQEFEFAGYLSGKTESKGGI